MIQFNVLSEIIFKSEQVLKISNDVLEMLYSCIGKKEGAFFWIMRHIYVCILNLKLYFERVEIFLWQFWHLCGCAGAGRGSSDCTSLCCPGLGRGRPGAQPVRRTRRPGLRGQRERESSCQCNLDSQPVRRGRETDRVSRSPASQCHAPVTVTLPSHSWQPLSRMSQWDPRVEARCGGGQGSPVRPEDSPMHLWARQFHVTSRAVNIPADILSWLTSVFRKEREERAGVGPWQWPAPCVPSLAVRNSQSIADSDTGHWTLARLIAVDTRWPSPAPCHRSPCTQRFKSP